LWRFFFINTFFSLHSLFPVSKKTVIAHETKIMYGKSYQAMGQKAISKKQRKAVAR
jgi:hypothetical protein